jgi:hypothetical protein
VQSEIGPDEVGVAENVSVRSAGAPIELEQLRGAGAITQQTDADALERVTPLHRVPGRAIVIRGDTARGIHDAQRPAGIDQPAPIEDATVGLRAALVIFEDALRTVYCGTEKRSPMADRVSPRCTV